LHRAAEGGNACQPRLSLTRRRNGRESSKKPEGALAESPSTTSGSPQTRHDPDPKQNTPWRVRRRLKGLASRISRGQIALEAALSQSEGRTLFQSISGPASAAAASKPAAPHPPPPPPITPMWPGTAALVMSNRTPVLIALNGLRNLSKALPGSAVKEGLPIPSLCRILTVRDLVGKFAVWQSEQLGKDSNPSLALFNSWREEAVALARRVAVTAGSKWTVKDTPPVLDWISKRWKDETLEEVPMRKSLCRQSPRGQGLDLGNQRSSSPRVRVTCATLHIHRRCGGQVKYPSARVTHSPGCINREGHCRERRQGAGLLPPVAWQSRYAKERLVLCCRSSCSIVRQQ
jgi:hypothetical protein